ncbi:MAG: DUF3277 family protein [Clostridia bacterium]|nr:DUF3277 family protein [Clostridia bacterium]
MAYNVYSFPDVKAVLNHSDVGQCNLHQSGMGKITVSSAGDLSSHTTTADGDVIVNRLKTINGTITIEGPQGSVADWFLRKWARWARSLQNPNRIALGVLTITDTVGGYTIVCTGVSLQKVPDRVFDRTAGNVAYTFLATTISEQ